MNAVARELRLALRSALRRPGLLAVAVLSLAIGVGANAAVFTVFDSLFLRPIEGVRDPDRVVEVSMTERGRVRNWDFPDFVDVRERVSALSSVAAFDVDVVSLSDEGPGELLLGMFVTSGYFESLGVEPLLGRAFEAAEDVGIGEHRVAVVSYSFWHDRFQGDPGALGRTIRLNREAYTVVGVAPPGFRGHQFALAPAVWLPLTQYAPATRSDNFFTYRGTMWASVVGRLADGVTATQVDDQLAATFAGLEEEHPQTNANRSARVASLGRAPAEARTQITAVFAAIGGLMLLVLGATCANVGGMILARAAARQRELAVRMALGSGRGRVVRHLLAESMIIFALGGAAGILVATTALRLFDPNRLLPVPVPVALDFALDWRVLGFGVALTLGTGLLFGLVPALQATRADLAGTLREQGGAGLRGSRLRRVFVGGQVGVSVLLLAAAGLFLRSVQASADIDSGFDPVGVYVAGFDLSLEGYTSTEEAEPFLERLRERLRSMPGVVDATVATDLPLDGGSSGTPVWPDGRVTNPDGALQSYYARVTPGYFETLGIALERGRTFDERDTRLAPRVAVVNEMLAERAWPGEDPVGRTVEFGLEPAAYTVVGVVANTRTDLITDDLAPQVYSLIAQDYGASVFVAAKLAAASPEVVARLRPAILSVDPALALSPVRSLASYAGLGTLPHRVAGTAATTLGVLALLLSAIGVYGVVAFSVVQRTREIGVRMALGARRSEVLGLVVRGGLALAYPGLLVGGLLAAALGRLLGAFLLGVSPIDPVAFGIVATVIGAVVVLACAVPARRAASVQPLVALRQE